MPVLPRSRLPTKRAYGVVAKGFNMYGEPVTLEGTGHLARCVQHETDHLDGVLFFDRLDPVTRKLAMKEIREAEWWRSRARRSKSRRTPPGAGRSDVPVTAARPVPRVARGG